MRICSFLSVVSLSLLAACGGGSKVAGSYALDTKALVDSAFAQMKTKMPAGTDEAQARQIVEGLMGKATADLELKADGTVSMVGEFMGQKSDAKGTWTEANGQVTMKTKEGDKAEETKTAKVGDGTLTVSETKDGMSIDMVFRKK